MALDIGERTEDSEGRIRFRAKDSHTGSPVGVSISHEAFEDHGQNACLDKACEKYDGSAKSVDVTTSDFNDA